MNEQLAAIRRAWGFDTCYPGVKWSLANPSIGQCAVTALVVEKLLGGYIVRAASVNANGREVGSHYWNILETGESIDMTLGQWAYPVTLWDVDVIHSDALTANSDTRNRYEILLARTVIRASKPKKARGGSK